MRKFFVSLIFSFILLSSHQTYAANCTNIYYNATSTSTSTSITPETVAIQLVTSGAALAIVKAAWQTLPTVWGWTKSGASSLISLCRRAEENDIYQVFLNQYLDQNPARGIALNFLELLNEAYEANHNLNHKFKRDMDDDRNGFSFMTPRTEVDFSLIYAGDPLLPRPSVLTGGSPKGMSALDTYMRLFFGGTDKVERLILDIGGLFRLGALHLDLKTLVSQDDGATFPQFYVYIPLPGSALAHEKAIYDPLYMLIKTDISQASGLSVDELLPTQNLHKTSPTALSGGMPWPCGPVTLQGTFEMMPASQNRGRKQPIKQTSGRSMKDLAPSSPLLRVVIDNDSDRSSSDESVSIKHSSNNILRSSEDDAMDAMPPTGLVGGNLRNSNQVSSAVLDVDDKRF